MFGQKKGIGMRTHDDDDDKLHERGEERIRQRRDDVLDQTSASCQRRKFLQISDESSLKKIPNLEIVYRW